MTHGRREIGALLERVGASPSRALGQNFVADPNTVRRIASAAGLGPGDQVVEIGPGLGSLTLALVETGARVLAVERDRRLVPVLDEVLADAPVEIFIGDATDLAWADCLVDGGSWTLVANLPYNIATPLVLDILEAVPAVNRLVVMVQKEVGDRLVAEPGTPACGIPSVKASFWAIGRSLFDVSPEVFVPKPRVLSSVVELTRRSRLPLEGRPDVLFELVERSFGQRRKMLRKSLGPGGVGDAVFDASGVDGRRRPETLSLDEWVALARAARATRT